MVTKQQPTKNAPISEKMKPAIINQDHEPSSIARTGNKTRIIIKYDVGFGNALFIRGTGANLNWDKGIPMKNIKNDEWLWETETPFSKAEFKILINDKHYESGHNHMIHSGNMIQYTPRF
jgi:hypothetical protein